MGETRIDAVDYGDLTNTQPDYSVDSQETDGPTDQKETKYINTNWAQQFGYYKQIPELQIVIDAKATWTVGKGFTSNEITEMTLMNIKGNGVDTFNTILENMIRTYNIGGDAFAEIIRDDEGVLINLKPLDPGTMKIIANNKGVIIRYEQMSKTHPKDPGEPFQPEDIFHLSRNRAADEIHGVSLVDAVEWTILARNEAITDMKTLMHRHVMPIIKWQLDTDDATEIADFKAKADKATTNGENLFIPMGSVDADVLGVAPNATLNPMAWIQYLEQFFYKAAGVPQIIVGGAQEITEAAAKTVYLAYEQTISGEQLYVMEEVLSQLNLEIELTFPASLENELLTGKQKDGPMQAATPEDTSVQGVPLNPVGAGA